MHTGERERKKTCEYKNTKRVYFFKSPWTPYQGFGEETLSTPSFQIATPSKE